MRSANGLWKRLPNGTVFELQRAADPAMNGKHTVIRRFPESILIQGEDDVIREIPKPSNESLYFQVDTERVSVLENNIRLYTFVVGKTSEQLRQEQARAMTRLHDKAIPARYKGRCATCSNTIEKDSPIIMIEIGWSHLECAVSSEKRKGQ